MGKLAAWLSALAVSIGVTALGLVLDAPTLAIIAVVTALFAGVFALIEWRNKKPDEVVGPRKYDAFRTRKRPD